MTNIDKAADLLHQRSNELLGVDSDAAHRACQEHAQALADAGLLAPELPGESWPQVWEVDGFLVTAIEDGGATIGLAENEGDGNMGYGWFMDRHLARKLALALLAAANHAQEEPMTPMNPGEAQRWLEEELYEGRVPQVHVRRALQTLADMSAEERAQYRGMWCEDENSNVLCIYMGDHIGRDWIGECAYPGSEYEYASYAALEDLTPRPDLPRAWQADGTPPAGKWEHAERLSMGVTTVYLCGKENPTHRQWIGDWEEA